MIDTIQKMNGRLEPADEHEIAIKKGKPFKCEKCGVIQRIENVQFGEEYRCAVCNSKLIE